ncbi:hypothetical protein [Streptomyces melanogenes]|uniref:hypothetical protein n=1 Tax=Streptomyces melanogenes TaxID=67326 RepID=UPI00167C5CCF|nr:hypothetical protein [Streptomyces melanogenes]GGP91483.1 hypothetical protein GCM10010278_82200 [Streptomyces melanogenes]
MPTAASEPRARAWSTVSARCSRSRLDWVPLGIPRRAAPRALACGVRPCGRRLPETETGLQCTSDYKGVVVPAGGTVQWQVNLEVLPDAPRNTTLEYGNNVSLNYLCGCELVFTPNMTMKVNTGSKPL